MYHIYFCLFCYSSFVYFSLECNLVFYFYVVIESYILTVVNKGCLRPKPMCVLVVWFSEFVDLS